MSSHVIFFDSGGPNWQHFGAVWEFDGTIMGVMSDHDGDFEVATSPFLKSPDTLYYPTAPQANRGFDGGVESPLKKGTGTAESPTGAAAKAVCRGASPLFQRTVNADSYSIVGDSLTVNMWVSGVGDWIRVLTAQPGLPIALGDLNCDGSVDFDDINPFVLALTSQTGYAAAFSSCNYLNGDGDVDFDDIKAFVALLSGS